MVCVSKFSKLYALLFAIVIAILGICVVPNNANALNVNRTGINSVEGASIAFEYIPSLHNLSEVSLSGGFYWGDKDVYWNDKYWDRAIWHNGNRSSGNYLSGSVHFRWNNIGMDLDGDWCDFVVDVTVERTGGTSNRPVFYDYWTANAWDFGTQSAPVETGYGDNWFIYHFNCKVVKAGTNNVANGKYLLAFKDIDIVDCEYIKLNSGFSDNDSVYVNSDCTIAISENGTRFDATTKDEDTYTSGFVVPVNAEFSFTNGVKQGAGSLVFEPFVNYTITAWADTGGSVTYPGAVKVPYHGDRNYRVTPAKYYKIKDVKIDGSSIGTNSTYSFNKLTADHKVEAWFESVSGTVKLQKRDADTRKTQGQGSLTLENTTFQITCVESPFYENGSVVATLLSNVNGYAQTTLLGGKFEVKETGAPAGYELSDTSVKTFEILTDGQVVDLTDETNSFYDNIGRGGVQFRKLDADSLTGTVQGDADLGGAVFNVYNVSDTSVVVKGITYPTYKDLKKTSIGKFGDYNVGEYNISPDDTTLIPCWVLTTNENGYAFTSLDLPLGKYVICEKSAPTGYLVDDTLKAGISFEIVKQNEMVAFIKR